VEAGKFMPQISETLTSKLDHAQAIMLAQLVDLEACWENLRKPRVPHESFVITMKDLSAKQKAYDAFRVKLAAYNKRFRPAHIPELLLNTPIRLARWCRAMRNLYLQIEHDPQGHCPVHLLEKAFRWADHIAIRMNKSLPRPSSPPATIGDAVRDLAAVIQWCDDLTGRTHTL
jgi:hypothetical protein